MRFVHADYPPTEAEFGRAHADGFGREHGVSEVADRRVAGEYLSAVMRDRFNSPRTFVSGCIGRKRFYQSSIVIERCENRY